MAESQQENTNPSKITPELVEKLAKELYKLLLFEARIENERLRIPSKRRPHRQGGWS
jgi:hypothetical protein